MQPARGFLPRRGYNLAAGALLGLPLGDQTLPQSRKLGGHLGGLVPAAGIEETGALMAGQTGKTGHICS